MLNRAGEALLRVDQDHLASNSTPRCPAVDLPQVVADLNFGQRNGFNQKIHNLSGL